MSNFHRLIFLLFLSFFSLNSFALIPKSIEYRAYRNLPSDNIDGWANSKFSAINNYCSWIISTDKRYVSCKAISDAEYQYVADSGPTVYIDGLYLIQRNSCPPNSTFSGSQCTCNQGYEEKNGNSCEPIKKKCTFGATGPSGWFDAGTSLTSGPIVGACIDGCIHTFDGSFPDGSILVLGIKHYFAYGSYINNGLECTEGDTPGAPVGSGSLPDDTCPPGKDVGTVNGQTVCAAQSNNQNCGVINGFEVCTGPVGGNTGGEQCGIVNGQQVCVGGTGGSGEQCGTVNGQKVCVGGSGGSGEQCGTVNGQQVCVGQSDSDTNVVPGEGSGGDGTGGDGTGGGDTGGGATGGGDTGGATGGGTGGDGTGGDGTDDEEGEKDDCEKNPFGEGCGGDPKNPDGKLYTEKSKTFSSVLQSAKSDLANSPIGSSTSNFFSVSSGGSCPSISGAIPGFNASFEFNAFCSPMAGNLLAVLRGVLILVATFFAFRIAIE